MQCPYDFREYQAPAINRRSADVSTHVMVEFRSVGAGFPDGPGGGRGLCVHY